MITGVTQKKALLVGVEKYDWAKSNLDRLRGIDDDIERMRRVLRTKGFRPDDIEVCTDRGGPVTKERIENGLRRLVAGSGRGHQLVFYFSGHGDRARLTDNGKQRPFWNEILCPGDIEFDTDEERYTKNFISDQELDGYFAEARKGTCIEIILDCCRAGGMSPFDDDIRRQQRLRDPLGGPGRIAAHYGSNGCQCVTWYGAKAWQVGFQDAGGVLNSIFTTAFHDVVTDDVQAHRADILREIRQRIRAHQTPGYDTCLESLHGKPAFEFTDRHPIQRA